LGDSLYPFYEMQGYNVM